MRYIISIFLVFSITFSSYAQKHRNSGLYIETHATQGKVLKSNDFVKGNNSKEIPIKDFSATDIHGITHTIYPIMV